MTRIDRPDSEALSPETREYIAMRERGERLPPRRDLQRQLMECEDALRATEAALAALPPSDPPALDVERLAADLDAALALLAAIQWYTDGKASTGLVWEPLKAQLDGFLADFPEATAALARLSAQPEAPVPQPEPLRAALERLLGTLDAWQASWQTSGAGWSPVSEAKAEARAALQVSPPTAQPEAQPAEEPVA